MSNESPHRGLKAAGAEAEIEQSQVTASPASFQLIARAIANAGEASEPLVAALAYAQHRLWPVFPCSPTNKRPLTLFGFKDATTEPRQIRNWWKRWPSAMIGVPTGQQSGVFVLDVDVDLKQNIDGFVALAALEKQYGNFRETLRGTTAHGGAHFFFCWRDGIKNSAGKLSTGLNVRGDGGYVVLPPSRRSDGRGYEWAELSASEPCEAPLWLINLLIAPKEKPALQPQASFAGDGRADPYARVVERECAAVALMHRGERNDALNRASFKLHQLVPVGTLAEGEVQDRLYSAAEAAGLVRDDGADADAVRATIESGATAGLNQPRAIPPHEVAEKKQTRTNKGLHFTLYRDIEQAPRKKWLVENIYGAAELSCDFGAPSCGKSVLAGDRAMHIAAGLLWFGRRVSQGAVLYIAAERAALVKRRLAAWRSHHGTDEIPLADIPLAIVSGAIDLRSTTDARKMIDLMHRLEDETGQKGVLIEIDTVSRVLAGGDENSSKDIGALIGTLTYIQEATNAHIGLVHHVPHDQQRMRGHGALLAACDTTVHVENAEAFRTARVDKTNDGAEGETLAFTFASIELHHDPDTDQITTAPIVQPVDGVPPKVGTKAKLTKADQIALRALAEAITDQGQTTQSNNIPSSTRVVSIETWRQQAYRIGVSTSDDASAKRKAFQRASERLIAVGRVGFYEGTVWLS